MANVAAQKIVAAAVSLSRTHPHAPALDVLDLVTRGCADTVLDFEASTPRRSLAAPGEPFGQLIAAAFDEAMTPTEWAAFTDETALPSLRDTCLEIWRTHVVPRFAARYGMVTRGLP